MNCGDQFALIENSLNNTKTLIEKQKIEFLKILSKDPSFKGFTPDPQKPAIAFYHNLAFLTHFISFFVYFKAFLDQYARFVSRLIDSRSSIFGFNKQNIDGRKISGGRLINWLRSSTPSDCANCSKLADIFIRHVLEWIDEIIQLRDSLVHSPYFLAEYNISILINSSTSMLSLDNLSPPKIPGTNIEILLYMEQALKRLYTLVYETLPLLPNVDFSMLPNLEHR
ncbi:MAG: hypothetical protein A2Y97_13165 [Nitrospirae bacterium RBG_13_39_12]|nr:MAG: hypothetical protein A2Y97_13165 [Nitrospirae bacterium RBG_13_39_12]